MTTGHARTITVKGTAEVTFNLALDEGSPGSYESDDKLAAEFANVLYQQLANDLDDIDHISNVNVSTVASVTSQFN